MHYFLIQLATDQSATDKTRLGDYFLKQPATLTLAHGHGQWFELVSTEEEGYNVFIQVALRLTPGDRIGVWEIPADALPQAGEDGAKWVRARGHLGELFTVPPEAKVRILPTRTIQRKI